MQQVDEGFPRLWVPGTRFLPPNEPNPRKLPHGAVARNRHGRSRRIRSSFRPKIVGPAPRACRESPPSVLLCGEFVLVEQAAESVAPTDAAVAVMRGDGSRLEQRRLLLERAVRPMRVVVRDVLVQYPLEVRPRDDQDPIEALAADAFDPALGMCPRPRRRDRRADHRDPSDTAPPGCGSILSYFGQSYVLHEIEPAPVLGS
jgi:hypothetical protein